MEFQSIERAPEAFQQPIAEEDITAICRRVFGAHVQVSSAVELGAGMYNNTYRVQVSGQEQPVVLRVAPPAAKQFRSERELMRNEYATVPWLTSIASLMPQVVAADWSHEVIDRDYLVQTLLDGVPAPDHLGSYPRTTWPHFFRQLGEIARQVHAIRGPRFGPVAGPGYATWAQALQASFADIAADVDSVGLDAADLRTIAALVGERSVVFDEVRVPRMLAGDLWTVNVMLDAHAAEPTITGVFDLDRTWWGDPAADWTMHMALAKPGTERDAFWDSYGPLERSAEASLRAFVYQARHIGAIRLERHRLGNAEGVAGTYDDMARVQASLG
ncbi:hypothetical protein GCM10010399_08500 [Dactylosporangium fulvum]|uniref:Aminoglycoside phosphotransferase family protein n=1 Tax=Dactylosporangium fulvum TaxID=53359 RepID=A0ABY5W8U5_9ACTN|nr:aminoglycoside phosphotransferase family protein [Dactylosporangium fulvum]UWP86512.1 aminoglycoside phosphotransferase family protein [Dactylosporangium fulvum]